MEKILIYDIIPPIINKTSNVSSPINTDNFNSKQLAYINDGKIIPVNNPPHIINLSDRIIISFDNFDEFLEKEKARFEKKLHDLADLSKIPKKVLDLLVIIDAKIK